MSSQRLHGTAQHRGDGGRSFVSSSGNFGQSELDWRVRSTGWPAPSSLQWRSSVDLSLPQRTHIGRHWGTPRGGVKRRRAPANSDDNTRGRTPRARQPSAEDSLMRHPLKAKSEIPLRSRGMALHPQGPLVEERPANCVDCTLRGEGLFSSLGPDEIHDRLQPIRRAICPPNQVIYRAEEPAAAAYTICCGVVKLLRRGPDGKERIVRLLGRGVTIGLEALDAVRYASSAVATRECNLCRIPRAVLVDLEERSAGFQSGLARQWRAHALQSEIWTSHLQGGALNEKARWLIRQLREISGDPAGQVQLLRNEDLADLLGVSAETLSRSMAKLKRCGLIRRVGPRTYDCRPFLSGPASESEPRSRLASPQRSVLCRIV